MVANISELKTRTATDGQMLQHTCRGIKYGLDTSMQQMLLVLKVFKVSVKVHDFLSQTEQTLCVYLISEVIYLKLKL